MPLHLRGSIFTTRRRREYLMVGTIATIYCCKESIPHQGIGSSDRTRPARPYWGTSDGVTHPGERFRRIPATGICP